MSEPARQAFNYIIIPIIMACMAVCFRGVQRFNRRLDPVQLMERAMDGSGDINPDFSLEDAQTHALSIVNSNIIITDHIDITETLTFDYSDDPIPTEPEDFKHVGPIPPFPQKDRSEIEIGDAISELQPEDPFEKNRLDDMVEFFNSSKTASSSLSLTEEFLDEEERYVTETVAEFFSSEGYGLDK